jgi:hypothetical protein
LLRIKLDILPLIYIPSPVLTFYITKWMNTYYAGANTKLQK